MDSDECRTDLSSPLDELHSNERLKHESRYLRGTIQHGLEDTATGSLAESDTLLTKFFGIYQQDDRDLREERRHAKLEPRFQFMVRVRLPGGVCTPLQWRALDDLATQYAGNTLRLTTRQTFQFHGIANGTCDVICRESMRRDWTPSRPAEMTTETSFAPPTRCSHPFTRK